MNKGWITRLFLNDVVFFLLCICLLYGVTYGTILNNFSHVQTDRYYWGNEEYPIDMLGNLAHIRAGYSGNWQFYVKLSSTLPEQKSFLKTEYLLLGHLARIFHLDTLFVFYASRALFSLFYLSVIYFIIRRVFYKKLERILALFFSLLGTAIYLPGWNHTFVEISGPEGVVWSRATLAPHHYMLGASFILLSLYFLSKVLDNYKDKNAFVFSVVTGLISSQVYAPNSLLVFTTFPLILMVKSILEYKEKRHLRFLPGWIGVLFSYSLIVALPIVYIPLLRKIQSDTLPIANVMEGLNPFRLSWVHYLLAVSFSYLFSWCALPVILKRKQTLLLFFATWLVMHPVGEFIISDAIGINRVRYFLTPYYVVFGILGAIGVTHIAEVFRNLHSRLYQGMLIVMMSVIITLGIPAYYYSQQKLEVCFCYFNGFDFSYPRQDLIHAIWWLRDHTKEEDIVLSELFSGHLIPAFAGNKVYTSWWYRLSGSYTFIETFDNIRLFFSGAVDETWVNDFLTKNDISYVLYSENERAFNPTLGDLTYSRLELVFHEGKTLVYKVRK